MLDLSLLPSGTVSCLLCRAKITVSCGLDGEVGQSLAKLRAHLTFDHEVHFDQDILIAVSFLELGEKEVIVENVMPRIKRTVETVRANATPGQIEKKLKEMLGGETVNDVENEIRETNSKKRSIESEDNEITCNDDQLVDTVKRVKLNYNAIMKSSIEEVGDSNEINILVDSDDEDADFSMSENVSIIPLEIDDGEDCMVCNIFIEKSALKIHYQSHQNEVGYANDGSSEGSDDQGDKAATEEEIDNKKKAVCDICELVLARKSLFRHKKNIHGINPNENSEKDDTQIGVGKNLKEKVNYVMNLLDDTKTPEVEKPSVNDSEANSNKQDNFNRTVTTKFDTTAVGEEDNIKNYKCSHCDNKYAHKDSVRRHERKVHNMISGINPNENSEKDDTQIRVGKNIKDQVNHVMNLLNDTKAPDVEKPSVNNREEHSNNQDDFDRIVTTKFDTSAVGEEDHVKNYKCGQCDNKYAHKESVRRHERKVHMISSSENFDPKFGDHNLQCLLCGSHRNNQQEILSCPVILSDADCREGIKTIQNKDKHGTLSEQIQASKVWDKILKFRTLKLAEIENARKQLD